MKEKGPKDQCEQVQKVCGIVQWMVVSEAYEIYQQNKIYKVQKYYSLMKKHYICVK